MEQTQILQEIRDDVRAVRSELTGVLVQVTALSEWRKATEKAEQDRDHEKRVRRLEEGRAWLIGAAAGAGLFAGIVGALFFRLLGWR